MGFWQTNTIQPNVSHSLNIRIIYNFTYRLSGNTEVAEVLTEKVLLMYSHNHDGIILLKDAWEEFLKYYGYLDFKGQDPIQQLLLSLSTELRCAVILRDIMGHSYEQIATILSKSNSEVAQLISRGRQKITKSDKKTNIAD